MTSSAISPAGRVRLEAGDMLDVLPRLAAEGVRVHAVITDPPYHLTAQGKGGRSNLEQPADKDLDGINAGSFRRLARGFMGKQWDGGDIAFRPETWRLCYDLLPPGGHLLAFAGTRTYHRIACAIEDAGFEIRDMLAWLYGSGFPKSHNVSKAIDRAAGVRGRRRKGFNAAGIGRSNGGDIFRSDHPDYVKPAGITPAARAWDGWGTALKPALEPICFARKPLVGTVAANVLAHGTGALNINACRVESGLRETTTGGMGRKANPVYGAFARDTVVDVTTTLGRWPANCAHDGSDEVVGAFPDREGATSNGKSKGNGYGEGFGAMAQSPGFADSGNASRFFYSAKADAGDRLSSKHPTVKPVDLMRWLVRLITPPGGTVLDPFAGSGTTAMACMAEGFDCIAVEREADYVADIRRRVAHVSGEDTPLFAQ